MSEAIATYQAIYLHDLTAEAEWLKLGAKAKANSVDLLTARLRRPFATLCEMGCGTGAVLEECMQRGLARNYIGVDSSAEALEWLGDRQHHALHLVQHDLEAGAPEIGTPVDLVVLSHVLEHLRKPQALLASLHNECNWVVAEVPLENQPLPRAIAWTRLKLLGRPRTDNLAGHVQFFSKKSFCKLMASAGWTIVSERTYLAYNSAAIRYSARRNGSPLWRSFAPYFLCKLLGRCIATRLFCVHYAVLGTAH